jgi:arginyl-tRNA synthetase
VYELVKQFNSYYQEISILAAHDLERAMRISLCAQVGKVIQKSLGLLGVDAPNRM